MRDDIDYLDDDEGHDLLSLGKDTLKWMPIKKTTLLGLVLLVVLSTTFIDHVLAKIPGSVALDRVSDKGTIVQIIVILIAFIVINFIVDHDML